MPEVTAKRLTDSQRRKLERLRLYGTAYEIAVIGSNEKYLIGYGRKSKRGILEMIEANDCRAIYQLSKVLHVDPHSWMVSGDRIARSGSDYKIVATGRTEREAITGGALESIWGVQ